jgi:hypothetical protein
LGIRTFCFKKAADFAAATICGQSLHLCATEKHSREKQKRKASSPIEEKTEKLCERVNRKRLPAYVLHVDMY